MVAEKIEAWQQPALRICPQTTVTCGIAGRYCCIHTWRKASTEAEEASLRCILLKVRPGNGSAIGYQDFASLLLRLHLASVIPVIPCVL